MKTNTSTVFVGLSGGVDSAVSALLLKAQGYKVYGLFMKNWEEDDTSTYCSAKTDLQDAKALCKIMDIPLHTVNFSQEYWQSVFSLFLEEYQKGRTPNPDILCNKEIKFKAFLQHALQLGADFIATGHYVQKKGVESANPLEFQLLKGCDQNKDQSYFLYTLGQDALQRSIFPIGDLEKSKVRLLAKQAKLPIHNKKDSTGICFIGERKFSAFLKDYLPCQVGLMKTPEGKTIGQHQGLMFYTLGQRHGLGIGGLKGYPEKPWYVVAKDIDHNILYVSQEENHPWQKSVYIKAATLYWVRSSPLAQFKCTAKVRYRQTCQACTVYLKENTAIIKFDKAQRAVTPGQAVVFYDNNQCLGGGTIVATDSEGGILQSKLSIHERRFYDDLFTP